MTATPKNYDMILLTAGGLEDLCLAEYRAFCGAAETTARSTGELHLQVTEASLLRFLCGSRISSRILVRLTQAEISDAKSLYSAVQAIDWLPHLPASWSLQIQASTRKNQDLRNDRFVAQVIKDAIFDQVKAAQKPRPQITAGPNSLPLVARIVGNRFWLGVDIGGGPLHLRGYRQEQGSAPLRETLAAALLWASGWQWGDSSSNPAFSTLFDPAAGSGTFIIEGVLARLGGEPGLERSFVPQKAWPPFPQRAWQELCNQRRKEFKEKLRQTKPFAFGFDKDKRMAGIMRDNAVRAGISSACVFECRPVNDIPQSPHLDKLTGAESGLLITNPPYGERIGSKQSILRFYKDLGALLQKSFKAWTAAILCADREHGLALGLRRPKLRKVNNGSIPCELLLFAGGEARFAKDSTARAESAEQKALVNRIQRRLKHLRKWATREKIEAFRVYDADMTEFRFMADLYGKHGVVIQEYRAPKHVDQNRAARRRREFLAAIATVFELPETKIFFKERQRQQGKSQYKSRRDYREAPQQAVVHEGDLAFYINLDNYLDTGLFLDHRPLRQWLQKNSKGKRVLNLFCYTGSLSVAAAMGRATHITSVDLSPTYCEWVERNFTLNKLRVPHKTVQADVMTYLQECQEKFDLILLDPPTFSNSKRTSTVLDIQRDHGDYLQACAKLLSPTGQIFFSTNARKFKLDTTTLEPTRLQVRDWTKESIPQDFRPTPPPHRAWWLTRKI